jgi:dTDP-4-dehydrorhamnose 3,5-epimerase
MIFREMEIKGAYIIEPERIEDERGFFARTWCQREFEKHGLNSRLVQTNISFSKNKGTLRGMHYQIKPNEEAKLIRCTRGEIFDVIIDLRPESITYKRYINIRLSESNLGMLYVPEGFAHGFQTLENDTEVFYQMSEFYDQGSACGVRWNDPAFAIEWPQSDIRIMSERDRNWPDYEG